MNVLPSLSKFPPKWQWKKNAARHTATFLQRLADYPLSDLLHSGYGVVVCQLDPEPLKSIELLNRHLVLEATDGSLGFLSPPVGPMTATWWVMPGDGHESLGGNSISNGPTKRSRLPTSFMLPDGRIIEIGSVLLRSLDFTCWGLSRLKTLPPNYIRI